MSETAVTFDPKEDGRSHINIYSKGRTVLGRLLSNFTYRRFYHPTYGNFSSMEGLYYYVSTGCTVEKFRRMHGITAKREGQKHKKVPIEGFEDIMRLGLQSCYLNDDRIPLTVMAQLKQNDNVLLPFVHYYDYMGKIVVPEGNNWVTSEWEIIRKHIVENHGGTVHGVNVLFEK